MIDGVCPRILTTFPNEVFLTIHDGLLVTESIASDVERFIREEFAEVGLKPGVKRKGKTSTACGETGKEHQQTGKDTNEVRCNNKDHVVFNYTLSHAVSEEQGLDHMIDEPCGELAS